MTNKHTKLEIATELLQQALSMYYEQKAFFAAIHLAGAVDDLLGAYIRRAGGEPSFTSLVTAALKISKNIISNEESSPKTMRLLINRVKNETKHLDDNKSDVLTCDPESEAKDLLDRAVSNYYLLMRDHDLPEFPLLSKYNEERGSRYRNL